MPSQQKISKASSRRNVLEMQRGHTERAFEAAFRRRFHPRDEVEADLVEQMISMASQLRRRRSSLPGLAAAEQESLLRGYRHTLVLLEQIRALGAVPEPPPPLAVLCPRRAA